MKLTEMKWEDIEEQRQQLEDDLRNELGDKKDNLSILLELEREITLREEQPHEK